MPFLRALRRLLTLALITGVGLILLLVYVLPRIPPQDLPWTPLDLRAPVGLATAGKIAALRGPACRMLLDQAAFFVTTLGTLPLIWWVVLPFLRWRTTTYTVTNRRLITRRGVLNKVSLDVPLDRIHEVSQERSLSDRMFGCGTLQIQTAAEDGLVVLADVPEVEHVHAEMTGLLLGRTP